MENAQTVCPPDNVQGEHREATPFELKVWGYRKQMIRHAHRMLRGLPDRMGLAEDLVQDSILKAFRNGHQFKADRAKLSTWLIKITQNTVLDFLRLRRRKKVFIPLQLADNWELYPEVDLVAVLNHTEERYITRMDRTIERALLSLPVKYRTLIVLRDLEGLSYPEIGTLLAIPQGTVKSRLNHGRKLLRQILGVSCQSRWNNPT